MVRVCDRALEEVLRLREHEQIEVDRSGNTVGRGQPLEVLDVLGDLDTAGDRVESPLVMAGAREAAPDHPQCERLARPPADRTGDLDSLFSVARAVCQGR